MYHPTEKANALTPKSWFYSLYLHTPGRHNDKDHPSRLEISFLLDSGASISVLNYPTYLTIAKLLNITCNYKRYHISKTLTVANQTEVPIIHYITATLKQLLNTPLDSLLSHLLLQTLNITFLEFHSLENTYRTSVFEILHYISNINPKINRIPPNSLLNFPKTIHISRTYKESILKHKDVKIQTLQKLLTFP